MSNIFGTKRPGLQSGWSLIGGGNLRVFLDPQNIFSFAKDDATALEDASAYVRDVQGSVLHNSITAAMNVVATSQPTGAQNNRIGVCLYDETLDSYSWLTIGIVSTNLPLAGIAGSQIGATGTPINTSNSGFFIASTPVAWIRMAWERVDASTLNVRFYGSVDGDVWTETTIAAVNIHPTVQDIDKVGFYASTTNSIIDPSVAATFYHFAETGIIV